VSTWGSNEELAALKRALPARCTTFVKSDHAREPDERGDDDLLIRADKNPNRATACALFPLEDDGHGAFIADTDVVLVWGEGLRLRTGAGPSEADRAGRVPAAGACPRRRLHPAQHPDGAERPLHELPGRRQRFSAACFAKPSSVVDAEAVFAAIAVTEGAPA
jgi:hypothetical protein